MPIITDPKDFKPGKWYACGFEKVNAERGEIDWGGATLAKYEGEGCWSDENGERDRLWDPVLQQYVAMDAADAYAEQP